MEDDYAMLSGYRVLDLTDERGLIAGMVLADLGADVIQVEPPGGSSARRVGPFVAGRDDCESSLFWWAYARNKRGITLDLDDAADRAALLQLVAGADCVIESFTPGYLDQLGLGYEALAARNPGIVLTSISPFGQTGPKATWPATDLTIVAASGYQYSSGDVDRAPLRVALPQAYHFAGVQAAGGTLVALRERRHSGLGQHVDVSAEQAVIAGSGTNALTRAWTPAAPASRDTDAYRLTRKLLRSVFPAQDGYVCLSVSFGSSIGAALRRMMAWIYEEGMCSEAIRDKDWVEFGLLITSGVEPASELDRLHEVVAAFTSTKTKAELFKEAQRRNVLLSPVSTTADVIADPHLDAREFWLTSGSNDESVRYPGPFAKFSTSPITYQRRAPRLGEHTSGILGAAKDSAAGRLDQAFRAPAASHAGALEGLKVLDLSWVYMAPSSVRPLADFGATVIKVESTRRIDTVRTLGPHKDGQPGPDRGGAFHQANAGKLGLTLNLASPQAQEVVKRLAQWADVVVESFTPKVMRGWGLDWEVLHELNPRLIYASTCLGGQWGPYSQFAGYGTQGAALAGVNYLCRWQDRPPIGPHGPYTDYVAAPFFTCAILAALEERERTGVGQQFDMAQMEASIHFMTTALLDYNVNGNILSADGNRDPHMAPHGVFRCLGDDRWIAIAIENDSQWRALCDAMHRPDLAADERYAALAGRKCNEDVLDHEVEQWTASLPAEQVQDDLVARGVPSHIVANAIDVYRDEQLAHRGHFVTLSHHEIGEVVVGNSPATLSRTPARITRPGPTYGQDASYVLTEILRLSPDEIAILAESGALE